MILKNYKYLAVIDFEATCNNDRTLLPRKEMEIIEIGAAIVEIDGLHTVSEFNSFIRPVRHPVLSDFCKELTTITQEYVDNANAFPIVMEEFGKWLNPFMGDGVVFSSWGAYDKHQLLQDCAFHGVEYPFNSDHLNLKRYFSLARNVRKQYGMATAMRIVNIPMTGTHHRGIDDVRNIVKLLPHIIVETPHLL